MAMNQRYAVNQLPISTLFAYVSEGEIAIPEIQRPFVWTATKVRDLLDSLLQGFPIGFLIAWKNPDVKLKDGSKSSGKRILIDGQQRVTALRASFLGEEVVNKDYRKVRIRIGFNPIERRFEVANPAMRKNLAWIPDISELFAPSFKMLGFLREYCRRNPDADEDQVHGSLENLLGIVTNQIGLIELDSSLDIETVTEIFIRVNSAGVPLSQADFAMSKIAVNEVNGGNELRKVIDYFCHLAISPDAYKDISNDTAFVASGALNRISWMRNENDALYDPDYVDVLRVTFTSEFRRGRLADLVALLSGRNFETLQFEEAVVDDTFIRLRQSVDRFTNEHNFKTFLLILRSTGFVDASMFTATNAVNFAYILYLILRRKALPQQLIERYVRRWFVMSMLTSRHSGSFESTFSQDVRLVEEQGIVAYADQLFRTVLSDTFWELGLPGALNTATISSPFFKLFQASQVKGNDHGFLSSDITVRSLIEVKGDIHHLFPKDYLEKHGVPKTQYNQIANFAQTQSEINIAIGNKAPTIYFGQLREQVHGGDSRYGNITDPDELAANLWANAIPEGIGSMDASDYPAFLEERRKLMAAKIRSYFEGL
jgi:hypothetical protein